MRILHYINQFFGQIGGEEAAYKPIEFKEELIGPGKILSNLLRGSEIVVTAVCGDNFAVENEAEVKKKILEAIKKYNIDMVVCGPAFNAGRYGIACGSICKIAFDSGVTAVSAMYEQNPGLELYRKYGYIFPTKSQARDMKSALDTMAVFINKVASGEKIGLPEEDGYFRRGIRRNVFRGKIGAERAVDMALKKVLGVDFETEVKMPKFEKTKPSPAVEDLSKITVALGTSGGIVPLGNPDGLESLNASKWCWYTEDDFGGDVDNIKAFTVHGGYDPAYANENANRVLPADAMKVMEKDGVIGKFYDKMFVTVGNSMDIQRARKYGEEIAKELIEAKVDAVIITST